MIVRKCAAILEKYFRASITLPVATFDLFDFLPERRAPHVQCARLAL